MKANPHETNRRFWLSAAIGLALLFVAATPRTAMAQWNPSPSPSPNNNIYYNAGNVGIGTTSPSDLLHLSSSANTNIRLTHSDSTSGSNGVFFNEGGTLWGFINQRGSTFTMFGELGGQFNLGNANFSGATGIHAGGLDRLHITSGGNVGIGTTTPGTLVGGVSLSGTILQVRSNNSHAQLLLSSGASGFVPDIKMENSTATVTKRVFESLYDGGSNAAKWRFANESTGAITQDNVLVLSNTGNVGIGTASPSAPLQVNGAEIRLQQNNSFFSFYNAAGTRLGYIQDVYNADLRIMQEANQPLTLWTNATERLRVDAIGNVGIGLTTPGQRLSVFGTIESTLGGFKFPNGTLQTTAATMTGVTAGAGLTGGGTSGAATVDIGQGTGVTVAADSISVNYGSTSGTAVEGNKQITITTNGSSGLSGGAALTLGTGGTLTLTNADKGSSQNIFKNISNEQGTIQFSAGPNNNNDSIRFAGSGGTTVTFDNLNKKVTIDATGSTGSAANISSGQFGQNTGGGNYTFPGNVTVNGNIAAKYQDMAEWVPSSEKLPTGTVVVLDSTRSNQVISSTQAYDTRVAGVISEQPGIALGESGAGKVLVATTGRVLVNVDATKSPIHIGDLLVTSDVPGMAMKSEPVNLGGVQLHRPGTLIGKALEPLEKGSAKILVLLSLQ